MKRLVCVLLVCACAGLSLHGAGSVTMAKPEDVGLSSERLMRVHEAVQRHIDAGSLSGAVTLVARHGKIAHLEAHGLMDVESKKAMPKDGVFRLGVDVEADHGRRGDDDGRGREGSTERSRLALHPRVQDR